MDRTPGEITRLMARWSGGDEATFDELVSDGFRQGEAEIAVPPR